jgi:hypothetical protein
MLHRRNRSQIHRRPALWPASTRNSFAAVPLAWMLAACAPDGAPTEPATDRPVAGTQLTASVVSLTFNRISAGVSGSPFGATCGVTPGDKAYCWGSNSAGQFGNGSTTQQPHTGARA